MNSVLSIFFKPKPGGFNKRLYELYLALADRGVRVHYVAAEKFPVDHVNISAHIIRVPFSKRENYIFWAFFIIISPFVLLHIAIRQKIDRFVVFEPFYACLCLLAKYLSGKSLITFIRSDVAREYEVLKKPGLQRAFNKWVELLGLKVSDKIVPNSNLLAKTLKERNAIDPDTFSVIPNNIRSLAAQEAGDKRTLCRQYGLGKDDFVISTAAVFNETKNISFLVRSFARARLTTARLLLIGDAVGKEKDGRRILEEQVRSLGIQERTIFTGWLEDPTAILSISDLFVLPSREEGSPNALLEALGCGIPCFGSRITEIGEVLEHDELMFSLSSEGELTEKINRAATETAFYTMIGELSARQKKKFTFDWGDEVFRQISGAQRRKQSDGVL